MRLDPPGTIIASRFREPRNVAGIIYPTGSLYLTSKSGLSNVPGTPIQGVLVNISSTSQSLRPDEGRSTIGTMSVEAVDLGGNITGEIRDQLLSFDYGIRRREVRLFTGDVDDFGTFQRVETYVIDKVSLNGRTYTFRCADRSREQRTNIFDQKTTRLASTISETATTIPVLSTDGFEMLEHTDSFTHGTGDTWGYIRIRKSGEIIGYQTIAAGSFQDCERGLFGTRPQAIEVTASDDEKKPEIEEFIYLEMPGPQLLHAIQTGKVLDTSIELPEDWHMGIDEAFVGSSLYSAIGTDLYDPADETAGLVLRFTHLERADGKRFAEEQLHVPMGTYCPIDADGVLQLRRVTPVLSTASPVALLDASNVIEARSLDHEQQQVVNQLVVRWNYDGEKFTRTTVLQNAESISQHGAAPPKELKLQGLHVSRHTRATLNRIFDYYTDRYGAPPITMRAKLSRSMNDLEIGDAVYGNFTHLPDFTGADYLSRVMEVQSRRINWMTGELHVDLFASTSRYPPNVGGGTGPVIADAWYTADGTELSTVLTISAGAVTANGSLTGNADGSQAIYYYAGNLTINAGVTVTIGQNVRLYVRGTLTINGAIDGAGNGLAALTDPNTVSATIEWPGTGGVTRVQTLGSTRGSGGIKEAVINGAIYVGTVGSLQQGAAALSRFALEIDGSGNLLGLPIELRGTPGVYGAPVLNNSDVVQALGADGGPGGAGLVIVSRGLVFGASGEIDLSGEDGTAPGATVTLSGHDIYPGAGGGGSAGGLLVIMDGDDLTYPDLTDSFVANHGATPQTGNPVSGARPDHGGEPWTGYNPGLGAADMYEAAHLIQYAPSLVPGDDQDQQVPAPTALAADTDNVGVTWSWDPGPDADHDFSELWISIDNDRSNATLAFRGKGDSAYFASDAAVTRYAWSRNFKQGRGYSEWHPTSSTGGVSATFGGATGPAGEDGDDAISFAITANAPLQFVQAPNGGAWSHTTVDVTFTFFQGGSSIATHVIRFTRSGSDITGATQSESGEATTETFVSNGTPRATVLVTHAASGIGTGQTVTAVSGGEQGDPGADGDDGVDGADGEDSWTPVLTGTVTRAGKSFAKETGSADWDSSFHSAEVYSACRVDFSPHAADAFFAIGLSSTPGADASYTSIDYCWLLDGSGECHIFEGGVGQGEHGPDGTFAAGDRFAVVYDGERIRYTLNGQVYRLVNAPGLALGADSSFFAVDADNRANNVAFVSTALSAEPWTCIVTGNCQRFGLSFRKNGGAQAWDSSFYSTEQFAACTVQFSAAQTDKSIIVGLSAGGGSSSSYTDVGYGMFLDATGTVLIFESGSQIDSYGAYTTSSRCAVTYDGLRVRYWMDGTLLRSVAVTAGTALGLDSSFLHAGGQIDNLTFGPQPMGRVDLTTQVFNQLTAAFADAALVNLNISVNADGSLTGAGGGAPVISSLSGSVATGQLTTNVLAALQAVIGNLAAIKAELGSVVISTTGHLRSGASAYDADGGYWIGFDGGEPAISLRDGTDYLRMKPSAGIETNLIQTRRSLTDWGETQTFSSPTWTGFSSAPSGGFSYAVTTDGLWASLWTTVARTGTSNSAAMTISNLPAAIQPAGSSSRWVQAVGVAIHGTNQVALGAKIWEASHGSAGLVEFGSLIDNGAAVASRYSLTGWPTSGTKGFERGLRLIWPL